MSNSSSLFLIHLPGPIHGSSIVGKNFKEYIVESHDIVYPIQLARNKYDIGKFNFLKLIKVFKQLYDVFILSFKVDQFILFYTSNKWLLLRDIIFRLLLWRKKAFLIMHNKGINEVNLPDCLLKLFYKNCKVLLLSESLYSDVESYVKYDDVRITPNCLFQSQEILPIKKEYSTLKLLFLSNLLRSKGIFEAIELVKLLNRFGLKVSLDIVGMEMDVRFDEIKNCIKGFEHVITYHGPLYGQSKELILSKSNILIFPTRYPQECFPLVILESLAYSIPVITMNNGAIQDIVENNVTGYVFEQNTSVEEIAEWIQIKTIRDWEDMSIKAYQEYNSSYKLDKWIKMTKLALK